MPKDTFSRLPEEKRNRIVVAAQKEFFQSSYQEASINKIIKDAGIPRGSFYQYFEDKRDLFIYVMNMHMDEILRRFSEDLKEKKGDFFACLYEYVEHIVDHATSEKGRFARAIMMDPAILNAMWESIMSEEMQEKLICERGKSISNMIDMDLLNVDSMEDFVAFQEICGCVFRETINEGLMMRMEIDREKLRQLFYRRIRSLEKHYRKK